MQFVLYIMAFNLQDASWINKYKERISDWGKEAAKLGGRHTKSFLYLPSATKTSSNCSASVTLVHLMRMWSGSVFSGSWWNLHGRVMEPPRCVTTLPGAVCTITAPVSSSAEGRKSSVGLLSSWFKLNLISELLVRNSKCFLKKNAKTAQD